jgi:hypothetical protein
MPDKRSRFLPSPTVSVTFSGLLLVALLWGAVIERIQLEYSDTVSAAA